MDPERRRRSSSTRDESEHPQAAAQPVARPRPRVSSFIESVLDSPVSHTRPEPPQPHTESPAAHTLQHHRRQHHHHQQHQQQDQPRQISPRYSSEDQPMDGSPSLPSEASWASSSSAATTTPHAGAGLAGSPDNDSGSNSGMSRTLLPAQTTGEPSSSASKPPARKKALTGRVQVAAACLACRKRKVKCNGNRPTCARCVEQKLSCVYDSEPDSTRMLTLKRRQRDLETEVDDLRELFAFLQTRPEVEANEILRRIRTSPSDDVKAVMDFVRSGDLLLQRSVASPGSEDPLIQKIEEAAAAEPYAISVPARPWTTIVGNGLVSELIGAFFAWDGVFWLPFIDRTVFIKDMRSAKPETARYCSPLLVHAMCAMRASTSPRAKALGEVYGVDIREKFLDEAKKILDQEFGRVSLPTAWALAIMFICSSSQGRDRAGMMYRFTAFDMLIKMQLPKRLEAIQENESEREAQVELRVYSRSLWGMYAYESCASFVYLTQTAFPRPTIPRMFFDDEASRSPKAHKFPDDYPISAAILDACCDFSDIYNEIMAHNRSVKAAGILGSEEDMSRRMEFFNDIQRSREALPSDIRADVNFTPATFYLDSFADQVVLAIFRPLPPDTPNLGPELGTAGDICISCCESGLAGAERHERDFSIRTQGYSVMAVYPLYNAAFTLVSMLGRPEVHDLFVRTCHLLAGMQDDYSITAYCLRGIQALAERAGLEIPAAAQASFAGLKGELVPSRDVPFSFVLPGWDDLVEFLNDDEAITSQGSLGIEMGTLIAKWNAMSTS